MSEFSPADSGFHFFQISDLPSSDAGKSCHSNEGSPLPWFKVTSGDGEEVGRNNKIWREKVDKETLAIIEVGLVIILVEILILFASYFTVVSINILNKQSFRFCFSIKIQT